MCVCVCVCEREREGGGGVASRGCLRVADRGVSFC